MDSPLARRPRVDCAQLSEDDDSDISGRLLFKRAHSISPLYRALLVVILSSFFSALLFSSLPLWRPFGVLMLHKLWEILRFVVLTTSIGLGIANINLWRGNDKDRDIIANASGGGKEGSVSSKVPFVSMSNTELQPSYSFSEKEMEVGVYGITRRSESGNGNGDDATMSASTAEVKYANIDKLANDIISHTVAHGSKASVARDVQSDTKHEKPSMRVPPVTNTMKMAPTKGKSRLVKASTDGMVLGTVDYGNELVGKTDGHRRGNSLEFPIEQEERARHRLGDNGSARDQRQGDVQDTTGDRPSSSARKVPSLVPKIITSDHTKGKSDASSSSKSNIQSSSASSSTITSKHSRSRSAYDLNDLLVYERRPARSKPVTTSQLARRRNVSLSCDLDKDYSTVGGVPAWLASVPSPPVPPLIDSSPSGAQYREIFLLGECVTEKPQDESSLRKAYTESLAPWRVATNAVPVKIPPKEATDDSRKHPAREEKKKASLKVQNTKVLSPPSSPSTPNSFMGSPSSGELKKKVDDFISRFHERMRLQRLESLERRRQAGPH